MAKKREPPKKIIRKKKDLDHPIRDDLYAKSESYGNHTLKQHSIEAARTALTIAEMVYPIADKEKIKRCSFISALFHDLGKAAVGFQNMIRTDLEKWPPENGGNRHEILSAVVLLLNLGKEEYWKSNPIELSSIYLAIITHHKPFKEELYTYPRTIPSNQWYDKSQFKEMYEELVFNKTLIRKFWNEVIDDISEDKWGKQLVEKYLPRNIDIPSWVVAKANFFQYYENYKIEGYGYGIIDKKVFRKKYSEDELLFFTLIRSITTVSDHLSSGGNIYIPPIPDVRQYPLFEEETDIPHNFQEKIGNIVGSVMLRAPTGSGKTEAALNWVRGNQTRDVNREKFNGKLFFVLPFQASINAMYHRLNDWFRVQEGQLIGLQHSRAANTLYSIIESEIESGKGKKSIAKKFKNPWKLDNIKSLPINGTSSLLFTRENALKYLKSQKSDKSNKKYRTSLAYNLANLTKEIFFPVKITTPHQLLKGILQGRGWEAYVMDNFESTIVFDEIHAYDPHLTGMILSMAILMKELFNARILFMSASFPTFLTNLIEEKFESIPMVELDSSQQSDYDILNKKRHMVEVKLNDIMDLLETDEFDDILQTRESILIICNTVASAQAVYKQLKPRVEQQFGSESIILFHSRFKIKDRNVKESKIRSISKKKNNHGSNLRVIVATQVVEVSLDIDLAFGIFEAAPLDALTQRFGRVNRKGKRTDDNLFPNVWICNPGQYSELIYDEVQTNYSTYLLQKVQGSKISETELVNLIDQLYHEHPWNERQCDQFDQGFKYRKITEFSKFILPGSYRYWIEDVIDNQTTMDVILEEDANLYRKLKRESSLEAHELIINLRIKNKKDLKKNGNNPSIYIGEYHYDSEHGLQKVIK